MERECSKKGVREGEKISYNVPNPGNYSVSLEHYTFRVSEKKNEFEIYSLVAPDYSERQNHSFTLFVRNEYDLKTAVVCTLQLVDINDKRPQFQSSRYVVLIKEGSNYSEPIIRVRAFDDDVEPAFSDVTYKIENVNQKALKNYFRIDPTSGKLFLEQPIFRNKIDQKRKLLIRIKASDDAPCSRTTEPCHETTDISIELVELNLNKPECGWQTEIKEILQESAPIGTVIVESLRFTDADLGTNFTYFIDSDNLNGSFILQENGTTTNTKKHSTGLKLKLVTNNYFNINKRTLYTLFISISDQQHFVKCTYPIIIEVQPANDEIPRFEEKPYEIAVRENDQNLQEFDFSVISNTPNDQLKVTLMNNEPYNITNEGEINNRLLWKDKFSLVKVQDNDYSLRQKVPLDADLPDGIRTMPLLMQVTNTNGQASYQAVAVSISDVSDTDSYLTSARYLRLKEDGEFDDRDIRFSEYGTIKLDDDYFSVVETHGIHFVKLNQLSKSKQQELCKDYMEKFIEFYILRIEPTETIYVNIKDYCINQLSVDTSPLGQRKKRHAFSPYLNFGSDTITAATISTLNGFITPRTIIADLYHDELMANNRVQLIQKNHLDKYTKTYEQVSFVSDDKTIDFSDDVVEYEMDFKNGTIIPLRLHAFTRSLRSNDILNAASMTFEGYTAADLIQTIDDESLLDKVLKVISKLSNIDANNIRILSLFSQQFPQTFPITSHKSKKKSESVVADLTRFELERAISDRTIPRDPKLRTTVWFVQQKQQSTLRRLPLNTFTTNNTLTARIDNEITTIIPPAFNFPLETDVSVNQQLSSLLENINRELTVGEYSALFNQSFSANNSPILHFGPGSCPTDFCNVQQQCRMVKTFKTESSGAYAPYTSIVGPQIYYTAQCEDKIEETNELFVRTEGMTCIDGPCQNGGTCVATNGRFYCRCPDYYLGPYCELTSRQFTKRGAFTKLTNELPINQDVFRLHFDFLLEETSGLILHNGYQSYHPSNLIIQVKSTKLSIEYNDNVMLSPDQLIQVNRWYEVELEAAYGLMQVYVTTARKPCYFNEFTYGEISKTTDISNQQFPNMQRHLFIGGVDSVVFKNYEDENELARLHRRDYRGCIKNIIFNGKTANLDEVKSEKNSQGRCDCALEPDYCDYFVSLRKYATKPMYTWLYFLVAVVLLALVLLIALIAFLKRKKQNESDEKRIFGESGENIVDYNDGAGEMDQKYFDLNTLQIPVHLNDAPPTLLMQGMMPDHRKHHDVDSIVEMEEGRNNTYETDKNLFSPISHNQIPPYPVADNDGVLHFAYEGSGSIAPSLSSLNASPRDRPVTIDPTLLNNSKVFGNLAKLYSPKR
ncbi:hypothetical protein SNEBB_001436 [Seison nebaliae]|nr:hypothetical protein SNEBB_001436 [Seison nebaliae]